ncbi:MAG: ATP-binding cassette domain-containing protein [Bacteroidota bacterium]|nr:ATP-binding cassette domain-containing protein [Bacteroidota bacterium]
MEAAETKTDNSAEQELVVQIANMKKSFGENHVLKDVTINVKKGENVVVLGKSGTGKSVLIKCLVGLIYPDGGKMEVLGKNIPDLNDKGMNEIRTKIGFLFQSGALYDSMTVRENLEFPIRRQMRSKTKEEVNALVMEALENVGLADAIDKMPSELSGGMRKRISLARTLILKPALMLYDEPTTGLDTITSKEISELILSVQSKYKTSSIIITHDMECARITANRIVILKEGKFIAEGTYDELKNSEKEEIRAFFI